MLVTLFDDIVIVVLICGLFGIGMYLSKSTKDSASFFNGRNADGIVV